MLKTKIKARFVVTSGLALTLGTSALALGAGPAGAASTATSPGVTANSITVGSISDISAPIAGLFEGAKVGTEAYFAMINSQGGVNGRKLVINGMDSAFSSGTVTNEAQSIAGNDFAIVGGFSLLDGAEQPAIDAGKVPVVTQVLDPKLYTDPNLYSAVPLVTGGEITGPFKFLKKKYPQDIQHVGVIGSNAAATAVTAEHTFHNLTNSLGYKWVYSRDAGFAETTFLPDMIKMKNAGVKLLFEPSQQGAYISTMAQENKQEGLNALLYSGANTYEEGFNPGAAGNGTLVSTVTALYMGQDAKVIPAVATFDKWAKKVDPQTQLDLYTLYGWINAQLFVQALKATGANPTRASLEAQLDKITSFNASGLISPQNPAQKIPGQCWIMAEYNNGNWARVAPDPKAGFVCNPGGFYPSSYKGVSR
ncbi:MAG TPA: ABC transporter substrate-binding protein [Acidimicrobiales bacterium]|jgi:ABC-type branched-subunit amino acid transport system substrate-binding protein|nr:ABC transporter substrate-binding protein [Acidimicrobiales bacterium]